jgi:uncharacterized repeat protein (TIGR01451 family)
MRASKWGLAGALAGCTLLATGCDQVQPWHSELVSVNASGTASGDGETTWARFSPDGTEVVLYSSAADLAPGDDTNDLADVYIRDLVTGVTTLVSADVDGRAAGVASPPAVSPDGTKVAFATTAANLGPTDTNGYDDVYIRDLGTGEVTLVSVDVSGTDSATFPSQVGEFSPDGTELLFRSYADDVVPGDTNHQPDIFLRDLVAGTTAAVSVAASGTHTSNGLSQFGTTRSSFTPDGTKVLFVTDGDDLGPVDDNGNNDVYVRDLVAGTTVSASVEVTDDDIGDGSLLAVFSPDGTEVAFESRFDEFVGPENLYRYDLGSGTTSLVAVDGIGPAYSPDGTGLCFTALRDDLGPTDTNGAADLYLRDLTTGGTTLLSADATGTDSASGASTGCAFSPDGTKVLFRSLADDLGPRDTNGQWDVYVRDLARGTTTLVSANATGTDAATGPSWPGELSDDGRQVLLISDAGGFGPTDENGLPDAYLATLHGADLALELAASPEPVAPGASLTYEIDVRNAGPDAADDTVAALLLPEGTTYASGSGACAAPAPVSPRLVSCDLGDLADGSDTTVTVTATVDTGTPPGTTLTALASTRSTALDANNADNTVGATSHVG